jgi:hypothetical protein
MRFSPMMHGLHYTVTQRAKTHTGVPKIPTQLMKFLCMVLKHSLVCSQCIQSHGVQSFQRHSKSQLLHSIKSEKSYFLQEVKDDIQR